MPDRARKTLHLPTKPAAEPAKPRISPEEQRAREAADQEAKSFELRAAVSLTRLWRDQRRRAEAHDLLAPIYNWFTEGFDVLDLKEAKALLEEMA